MSKNEQPTEGAKTMALVPATSPGERTLDRLAFEPQTWDQAFKVAQLLVQSQLLPRDVDTPQKAITIVMKGRELGLSTMQSLSSIYVIEGKPVMSADLIAALVISSGKAEYFEMVESSSEKCTYATKRRGSKNEQKITWTLDDAKRAELLGKANWRRYPAAMLAARVKAALARNVYPDIVAGIYDPDELEGTVIDVGHSAPTTPPPVAKTIGERLVEAKAAYNAFETDLGIERVQAITFKRRRELDTVDDWEKAVAALQAADLEGAPPSRASGPPHEEGPPTDEKANQPGPTAKQTPEETLNQPADGEGSGNTTEPVSKSEPTSPAEITDRDLFDAIRKSTLPKGTRLSELTLNPESWGGKGPGKNPDKLNSEERVRLHAYLVSLAKVGGAQ